MAKSTSTERVLPHEILDRFDWGLSARAGETARDREQVGRRIGGRRVMVALSNAEEAEQRSGALL